MSSQETKLRQIVDRLNKASARLAGKPAADAVPSDADLATLVSAVEAAVVQAASVLSVGSSTASSPEERLQRVLTRIVTATQRLPNAPASLPSASANGADLAHLVAQLELAVDGASIALGQGSKLPSAPIASSTPTVAAAAPVVAVAAATTAVKVTPETTPSPTTTETTTTETTPPTAVAAKTASDSAATSTTKTAETPLHTGDLNKLGGGMFSKWQLRKFELYADRLQWMENGKPAVRNSILLTDITKFSAVDEKKYKKKFVFELTTKKKVYLMQASDQATFDIWSSHFTKYTSQS